MKTTTVRTPNRKPSRQRLSWFSVRRDRKDRRAMLDHVATELAATMAIEESVFYPGVIQLEDEDRLDEVEVSMPVRVASQRVVPSTSAEAPALRAKITTLKRVILEHVREREAELLPEADEPLDERRLAEMGRRMKSLFFRVVEAGYRKSFDAEPTSRALQPRATT